MSKKRLRSTLVAALSLSQFCWLPALADPQAGEQAKQTVPVPQQTPAPQAPLSQQPATQSTQPPLEIPPQSGIPIPLDALKKVGISPSSGPQAPAGFKGSAIKPAIDTRTDFPTLDLDSLDRSHDENSTLQMDQLTLHSVLHAGSFQPIRLEVGYDETINLKEALRYAIDNNLAVKISKENLNYQRFVTYGQYANLLPNLSLAYNLTKTNILNDESHALAKVFLTRVSYPVFQGGSVVYGIMGQIAREKGWRQAYKASVSDELLDLYQKYNTLLLDRILLQIRAKAVEVSEEQLRINREAEKAATGTIYAVLQADAQLSSDKQALLNQQIAVRTAALALNFSMNYPMAANLVPVEETVRESPLFQNEATIEQLMTVALRNRPELREYELFKYAAGRNVQVAVAPLYPQASFFTQYSYTNTTNSPSSSSSSSSTTTGGGNAGAGVFGGLFDTYQQGFALVWSLNNFGMTSVANIYAAKSLDRQASVQANQELQTIIQQVRTDYLNWRAAREQIDNAAHGVRASKEELRLARLRLGVQVATELDVISAQRDYINSLTTQAQAIVNSNLAQAQLLHDTGIISTDNLLHGYRGNFR